MMVKTGCYMDAEREGFYLWDAENIALVYDERHDDGVTSVGIDYGHDPFTGKVTGKSQNDLLNWVETHVECKQWLACTNALGIAACSIPACSRCAECQAPIYELDYICPRCRDAAYT